MVITESLPDQRVLPPPKVERVAVVERSGGKESIEKLHADIEYALKYYCLGKDQKELVTNTKKLEELSLLLQNLLLDYSETRIDIDKFVVLERVVTEWQRFLEGQREFTEKKVQKLGFRDFEHHQEFMHCLENEDYSEAYRIAEEAEERLQASLPQWTRDVIRDLEEKKNTKQRNKIQGRIIGKLLALAQKKEKQNKKENETPSPKVFGIQAGTAGAGKSTIDWLPQLEYPGLIDANIDEVRVLLAKELLRSGDSLYQKNTENYNQGVYDDTDQAMVLPYIGPSKDIVEKLINVAIKKGKPILYQGTIRSQKKVQQWIDVAHKNGYIIDITHFFTPLEQSWKRASIDRPRGIPPKKFLEQIETYRVFLELVQQNMIDRFMILDNSERTPEILNIGYKIFETLSLFRSLDSDKMQSLFKLARVKLEK